MVIKGPIVALAPHNIDISNVPPSGLAEFRAYYGGTQMALSYIFYSGATNSASEIKRRDALTVALVVLGSFTMIRAYCYLIEGPPDHEHSHLIWSAELVGTIAAFVFLQQSLAAKVAELVHGKAAITGDAKDNMNKIK